MKWNSSFHVGKAKGGAPYERRQEAETINKTNAMPLFHSVSSLHISETKDDASHFRYKCDFAPSLDLFVIFHVGREAASPTHDAQCAGTRNNIHENTEKNTMKIKLMACCEIRIHDYDVAYQSRRETENWGSLQWSHNWHFDIFSSLMKHIFHFALLRGVGGWLEL